MSIRRMSLGAGYRYLMASVARADLGRSAAGLTRYYVESGTPAGRYLGAGLAGLGDGAGVSAGSVVSERALFRMLGMLQDPVTGRQLGRAPSEGAVAGFDLTFSAPKSVSVLWALAGKHVRDVITAAHHRAVKQVIGYAETCVFASRAGRAGVVTVPVRGVVAAGFDHWDSRAGDPQLHTHVVVLNRAQGLDGMWRTLDSKALFAHAVELSELYNGLLADHLTAALGVGWVAEPRRHSDIPKWEIDGVPAALREAFSRRSHDITTAKDDLIGSFRSRQGRLPTTDEVLRLRQQATLQTRPGKTRHTLAELTQDWRTRTAALLPGNPDELVNEALDRNPLPRLAPADLDPALLSELGRAALAAVADKRATFTRSNLTAEVLRRLHGLRLANPADRIRIAEHVTEQALSTALLLHPAALDPTALTRGRDRYTTPAILDAETRLIDLANHLNGPTAVADSDEDAPLLSPDQAAAVAQIATSGRTIDLLVGPAGSGKTTTMAALRQRWEDSNGPGTVLGLAPSATAAHVLSDELGIPADNTAKWLAETSRHNGRRVRLQQLTALADQYTNPVARRRITHHVQAMQEEIDRWTIHAGQLVIVDEASLAGTLTLDRIASQVHAAGAKLLLVGDPSQLGSIQAGGIFTHLANMRTDAPALTEIHRFTHPWEKQASQQLRAGNPTAITTYIQHGRVHPGPRSAILEQLLQAWDADTRTGKQSMMITPDHDAATELNTRAHRLRVQRHEVTDTVIALSDGNLAGIGDLVTSRRNDRRLTTSSGEWVKNGDTWTITRHHPDGTVDLQAVDSPARVTIPAAYAHHHLELGYATTLHHVQGRTTDTAHAYLTAQTHRNHLYVAASRGRQENHLYLDTAWDSDPDTRHHDQTPTSAQQLLDDILRRAPHDPTATRLLEERSAARPAHKPSLFSDGRRATARAEAGPSAR